MITGTSSSLNIEHNINKKTQILSYDETTHKIIPEITTYNILKKTEYIKLTLITGETILCMPNQYFLSDDNKWIMAKDIIPLKTRIKSLLEYSEDSQYKDYDNKTGFLIIGDYKFNLQLFSDYVNAKILFRLIGFFINHKFNNPTNNIDEINIVNDISLLTNNFKTITPLVDILSYFCKHKNMIFKVNFPFFLIKEFLKGFLGINSIITIYQNHFDMLISIKNKYFIYKIYKSLLECHIDVSILNNLIVIKGQNIIDLDNKLPIKYSSINSYKISILKKYTLLTDFLPKKDYNYLLYIWISHKNEYIKKLKIYDEHYIRNCFGLYKLNNISTDDNIIHPCTIDVISSKNMGVINTYFTCIDNTTYIYNGLITKNFI